MLILVTTLKNRIGGQDPLHLINFQTNSGREGMYLHMCVCAHTHRYTLRAHEVLEKEGVNDLILGKLKLRTIE